jgi:hypothetical protein
VGIANEEGLTVDQQKERARERQWEWEHYRERCGEDFQGHRKASTGMCSDPRVLTIVKGLIDEQYPSVARLGPLLAELEASRGGGIQNSIKAQEKYLESTKRNYSDHPPTAGYRKDAEDEIKRIEATIAALKERKKAEDEQATAPKQPVPQNEVIVSGEPFPIRFDRELDRTVCQIHYKITGPGWETINAVRGNALNTGVYTVQPGDKDWIVNLLSVS